MLKKGQIGEKLPMKYVAELLIGLAFATASFADARVATALPLGQEGELTRVFACTEHQISAFLYNRATEGGYGVEMAIANAAMLVDHQKCAWKYTRMPTALLWECKKMLPEKCAAVPLGEDFGMVFAILFPDE